MDIKNDKEWMNIPAVIRYSVDNIYSIINNIKKDYEEINNKLNTKADVVIIEELKNNFVSKTEFEDGIYKINNKFSNIVNSNNFNYHFEQCEEYNTFKNNINNKINNISVLVNNKIDTREFNDNIFKINNKINTVGIEVTSKADKSLLIENYNKIVKEINNYVLKEELKENNLKNNESIINDVTALLASKIDAKEFNKAIKNKATKDDIKKIFEMLSLKTDTINFDKLLIKVNKLPKLKDLKLLENNTADKINNYKLNEKDIDIKNIKNRISTLSNILTSKIKLSKDNIIKETYDSILNDIINIKNDIRMLKERKKTDNKNNITTEILKEINKSNSTQNKSNIIYINNNIQEIKSSISDFDTKYQKCFNQMILLIENIKLYVENKIKEINNKI